MLCNRLAIDLLGDLKMRAVSGIVGLGAMAPGTPAAPGSTGDGTRLKVTEFGDLLKQSGSVVDQSRQRVWHGASRLTVLHTLRIRPQKKKIRNPSLSCRTLHHLTPWRGYAINTPWRCSPVRFGKSLVF